IYSLRDVTNLLVTACCTFRSLHVVTVYSLRHVTNKLLLRGAHSSFQRVVPGHARPQKVYMSDQTPLWISEADVVSLMSMEDAINVLEKGLLAEARGDARNMVKTHVTWGKGSTLHAIGAVFAKDGFVGTKTWAHTEGGATPLLILFDSGDGSL